MATRENASRLVLTPSKLNLYRRCPHQYYLQYIERAKTERAFQPALERGNAMHVVLAEAFARFASERAFPIDLRRRVESRLPSMPYGDVRAWAMDVDTVLQWVREALAWFDGTATVLATERNFDRVISAREAFPQFTLRAKVDLVLEHSDGSLEIVDFKSGSAGWIDTIQNVSMRCVVEKAFRGRPVRNTVVFTQTGHVYSEILTAEDIRQTGAEIRGLSKAISADEQWLPVTNALCDYCAFIDRCPLYADDDPNDEADWFDAA